MRGVGLLSRLGWSGGGASGSRHGQGFPQDLDERQKGGPVKGELGAAASVGGGWVGHGGELGAREVVAIHGDEGGDGGGIVWGMGFVPRVEGCGYDLGEGCFACGRWWVCVSSFAGPRAEEPVKQLCVLKMGARLYI